MPGVEGEGRLGPRPLSVPPRATGDCGVSVMGGVCAVGTWAQCLFSSGNPGGKPQ